MVTAVFEMIIAVMASVEAHFSVVTLYVSTVMGTVVAECGFSSSKCKCKRIGETFCLANENHTCEPRIKK